MPNIIDLSVNCTSDCSLIGTSSVMRNFLLGKNLPQVPTDIIYAGLVNEWYNNGNVAPAYNNVDPQGLIDIGQVLDRINIMRAQHANINLYNDYPLNHYDQPNYTQYPLVSIDDSIATVTINNFGNIEGWTDPDEALIQIDTWDTKWNFELGKNRNSPSATYFNLFYGLQGHTNHIGVNIWTPTDNIISDFLTKIYNINSFITISDPTNPTTPLSYYQTKLLTFNKYKQSASDSYVPAYFGLSYFDYSNPNLSDPTLIINSSNSNIDSFTNIEGGNITQFPTANPQGVRDLYNTSYNDYSLISTYNPISMSTSYTNGSVQFITLNSAGDGFQPDKDLKDNSISNIDNFTLNVPDFSPLGFQDGDPLTPNNILQNYCAIYNIYGGTSDITSETQKNEQAWKDFIVSETFQGCSPYVGAIAAPLEYGIQNFIQTRDNLVSNLLEDYITPQTNIITYQNGEPLSLTNFGVSSDIQKSLGIVFSTTPAPIDAILTALNNKLVNGHIVGKIDTPLGNTGRAKLASEFYNRIALSLRQEAYGKAEQIGTGLKNLFGNLAKSVVGSDLTAKSDLKNLVDVFKLYEITVPKTYLGRAANYVASIAGVNAFQDVIKEPIDWVSNVSKTDTTDDVETITDPTDKRSFWNKLTGFGSVSKTNDPSSILLAYTSSGQKDLIKDHLALNLRYRPNYTFVSSGKKQSEVDIKRKKLNKSVEKNSKNEAEYQKELDKLKKQRDICDKTVDPDFGGTVTDCTKTIKRKQRPNNVFDNGWEDAKKTVLDDIDNDIKSKNIQITKVKKSKERDKQSLLQLDNDQFPFYPYITQNIGSHSLLNDPFNLPYVIPYDVFDPKDFTDTNSNGYKPIDNLSDISRYKKDRLLGESPETTSKESSSINIYEKVSDLLKHGPKLGTSQPGLRGLNIIADGTDIGYNEYPRLDKTGGLSGNKLHLPGLGRDDMYVGQSLFSVLESNGYVKVAPLWAGDEYGEGQFENAKAKKEKIVTNGLYEEKVKIQRYMFSIENLAWKGYSKNLPWQEQGPNGGRMLWFPPYDLRITDTTSNSIGSENLIGRNEPVYTYSYSERSGVLSFKMIMDFPGYHKETTLKQPEVTTSSRETSETTTIAPVTAPKSNKMEWCLDSDTYLYIIYDSSDSMVSEIDTITKIFGDNGVFKNRLITDGVYTKEQYNEKVFLFEDPGLKFGGDNIDDGRYFAWFASPYYKSKGEEENKNLVYNRNTKTYDQTAKPITKRLILKQGSNTIPDMTGKKVVVIGLTNDSTPAYVRTDILVNDSSLGPNTHQSNPNYNNTDFDNRCLFNDIVDYTIAKNNYSNFRGIVLGYTWESSEDEPKIENQGFNALLTKIVNGNDNSVLTELNNTNNISIQSTPIIYTEKTTTNYYPEEFNGGKYLGNYASNTTPIEIPKAGEFDDIKYCLGINYPGGLVGTDEGGEDSVNNIIYILKKSLSVTPEKVTDKLDGTVVENKHPQIGVLRKYIIGLTKEKKPNDDTSIKLIWSSDFSFVSDMEINKIIGTDSNDLNNVYDVEFNKFIISGYNNKSNKIRQSDTIMCSSRQPLLMWLQSIVGDNVNFTNDGDITSEGWVKLLKVINPDNPVVNQSIDPNNGTAISPKSEKTLTKTPWGIDQPNLEDENQLNEFLYFKRLAQTDPIYNDALKDKIVYFDPAFHSITPVGFNNRLNFLEQCARQGPSINNTQLSDGTIISANSNLAFGRPPVSVLRIGDFYYTRIIVEGVDLSYEPLIFDMNQTGIGVQPMIVDVTINFKYVGGSSLSGPVTELQNAISNNYFANVEFYNSQALKSKDRYNINPNPKGTNLAANPIGDVQFVESSAFDTSLSDAKKEKEAAAAAAAAKAVADKSKTKKEDKKSKTEQCQICPSGYMYAMFDKSAKYNPFKDLVALCRAFDATSNKNTYYPCTPAKPRTNDSLPERDAGNYSDFVAVDEVPTSEREIFYKLCAQQGGCDTKYDRFNR